MIRELPPLCRLHKGPVVAFPAVGPNCVRSDCPIRQNSTHFMPTAVLPWPGLPPAPPFLEIRNQYCSTIGALAGEYQLLFSGFVFHNSRSGPCRYTSRMACPLPPRPLMTK